MLALFASGKVPVPQLSHDIVPDVKACQDLLAA